MPRPPAHSCSRTCRSATCPHPGGPAAGRQGRPGVEFSLLTVGRVLGRPVGYLPEHGGDVVQNISPTRRNADRQVSTSSKSMLEFHTEAAFHPHRPRYLLLLCLRGDPSAATTLCSIAAVLDTLSPRSRAVLFQSRFTTGIDEVLRGAGRTPGRSSVRCSTAILSSPRCGWTPTRHAGDDRWPRSFGTGRENATGSPGSRRPLVVVDNDLAVHGVQNSFPASTGPTGGCEAHVRGRGPHSGRRLTQTVSDHPRFIAWSPLGSWPKEATMHTITSTMRSSTRSSPARRLTSTHHFGLSSADPVIEDLRDVRAIVMAGRDAGSTSSLASGAG